MTLEELAEQIEQSMAEVTDVVTHLGVQLSALHTVGFFGRAHLDEMARQLEGVAARALSRANSAVVGVGVVWEDGPKPEDRGMLWWRADDGEVSRKIHVNNPASDSFYDFAHSEWYQSAVAADRVVVVGPYIDAWGTDDHALTPSLAVRSASDQLIGVAAIDLDAYRTTEMLARVLAPAGESVVLVNDENHVVAANAPSLTAGLRLDPFARTHGLAPDAQATVPALSGWHLVRLA